MQIDLNIIEKERLNNTNNQKPEASVVVVTYNIKKKLLSKNLKSLFNQSVKNYEVIVVDNSDKIDMESSVCKFPVKYYIKLKENAGLSIGRNIGIVHAEADIVIFLDDDAIPDFNFIQEHLNAFKTHEIVGLRGKAKGRTRTVYNFLETHYDLGADVFPHYINLEGNSSFKKDILLEVGGFNSQIKGAGGFEGLDLTYRIINLINDRNKLVYNPGPVILHDFCNSFLNYFRKQVRHEKNLNQLSKKYPELLNFRTSYIKMQKKISTAPHSIFTRLRLRLIRTSMSYLLKLYKALCREIR